MTTPRITYLGRNYTDHTVTFGTDARRYEYHLLPHQCDTVEYLCRRISTTKALAFAKKRALSVDMLTLKTSATST